MTVPFLLGCLRLVGFLNFVLLSFSTVLMSISLFSITLLVFDTDLPLPPIVFIALVAVGLLILPIATITKLKNLFVLSYGEIERVLFGRRRFLVDAIVESYYRGQPIKEYETEEIRKGLGSTLVKQISFLVLFILIMASLLIFLFSGGNKGIEELLHFVKGDVKVEYSSYISSDIPLRVKVTSPFRGKFFIASEKIVPLTTTDSLLTAEVFTSSTNVHLIVQKYGIFRKLKTLNPQYLSEFSVLSQRVEVFWGDLKVLSYDYLPSLEIVEGSRVTIFLEFSHNVSDVKVPNLPSSKLSKISWKHNTENKNTVMLSLTPRESLEFGVEATDVFGRKAKIDWINISVRTNDIPTVVIKYPEKDLVMVSTFVLEGYGQIVDRDEVVDSWMNVVVTNSLTGTVKRITNVKEEKGGLSFSCGENFTFVLDSSKGGFLPGDKITVIIHAKDTYGAVGSSKVSIYLPTFSEISRMMDEELQGKKTLVSKQKEDLLHLRYTISKEKAAISELVDKFQDLKALGSSMREFSEKLKEIYKQIDTTRGLIGEFERLENISTKLQSVLNDREFNEIIEKLSKERSYIHRQVSKKLEDVGEALTELEMEINRLNEFRDILKSISRVRELREYIGREEKNLNEFDRMVEEFLKSEEFEKMSSEFKSSFMEKVKQLENALTEKMARKNFTEKISSIFKDIDFEIFKEIMRRTFEIDKKQREKFWEVYFGILYSQISMSKAKKNIDTISLRFPKIAPEYVQKEFKEISDAVKRFRLVTIDFLSSFSFNPNLGKTLSEIEYTVSEIEREFNFFTDAISSGISLSVSLSIGNMINKLSFVLSKLLDLLDNLEGSLSISPPGMSIQEMIERIREIMQMLSQASGKEGNEISHLEDAIEELLRMIKEFETKNPGDGNAREVREKIEEILDMVRKGRLSDVHRKMKEIEFNLLEHQRGIFEKGLSEKREAEKPKEYKPQRSEAIVELAGKSVVIKDSYIRRKYYEVIDRYKKALSE